MQQDQKTIVIGVLLVLVFLVLMSHRRRPSNVVDPPRQNMTGARALSLRSQIKRLNLPRGPDGTFPSNTAAFEYKGKKYLLVRYVFYFFNDRFHMVMNGPKRNYTALLDRATMTPVFLAHVDPDIQHGDLFCYGLEDARPIVHKDTVYITATTLSHTTRKHISGMVRAVVNVEGNKVERTTPLGFKDPLRPEKNWIPVVYKETLAAIYKLYPLVLVDLSKQEFTVIETKPYASEPKHAEVLSRLRGSTTLIKWKTGYLAVFHQSVHVNAIVNYSHHFVELDEEYRVVRVSHPFTFENIRVEYCMGIDWRNQTTVTLWYTLFDSELTERDIGLDEIHWA